MTSDFYECVLEECGRLKQEAEENPGQERDTSEEKLYRFYATYEKLRQLVPDTPIHELIELLLKETGYGDYAAAMPAGDRRHANLLMLVEKAIAYEIPVTRDCFILCAILMNCRNTMWISARQI